MTNFTSRLNIKLVSFSILLPDKKAFNPPRGESRKHAYLFESPIDALSYAQIKGVDPNAVYISTCGVLTHEFRTDIPKDLSRFGVAKIAICFDNGAAREKMAADLLPFLAKFEVVRQRSNKKDWNEELVLGNRLL